MSAIEWRISDDLVPYPEAVAAMEARVAAIREARAGELVWLLEHPPLYTAGTSAERADLLEPGRLPVYQTGRGGQYTYHGPGQRVAYVMLDLRARGRDVGGFVRKLEAWLIDTLAGFDLNGERRPDRVGIWIDRGAGKEDKIAAIGVRIRHWISYHGVALNLDPRLEDFDGIVPCGVVGHGVTSLADLGLTVTMAELDAALKASFERTFAVQIVGS